MQTCFFTINFQALLLFFFSIFFSPHFLIIFIFMVVNGKKRAHSIRLLFRKYYRKRSSHGGVIYKSIVFYPSFCESVKYFLLKAIRILFNSDLNHANWTFLIFNLVIRYATASVVSLETNGSRKKKSTKLYFIHKRFWVLLTG